LPPDGLNERSDWFCVERFGARLVHKCCVEGADLGCIRPRRRAGAPLAAFKDFPDSGLSGNVQGRIRADRIAVWRDDRAVIPRTIPIAEKVVAGIAREIRAGKVQSPASGRSGARRLSGGADVLRDQNRDGKHCSATDKPRHCFQPSDCLTGIGSKRP
jgi:hypothetical protein